MGQGDAPARRRRDAQRRAQGVEVALDRRVGELEAGDAAEGAGREGEAPEAVALGDAQLVPAGQQVEGARHQVARHRLGRVGGREEQGQARGAGAPPGPGRRPVPRRRPGRRGRRGSRRPRPAGRGRRPDRPRRRSSAAWPAEALGQRLEHPARARRERGAAAVDADAQVSHGAPAAGRGARRGRGRGAGRGRRSRRRGRGAPATAGRAAADHWPRRISLALPTRCLLSRTHRRPSRWPGGHSRGRPTASSQQASGRLTPQAVARPIHSQGRALTSMRWSRPSRGSRLTSTWEMPWKPRASSSASHRAARPGSQRDSAARAAPNPTGHWRSFLPVKAARAGRRRRGSCRTSTGASRRPG